MKKYLFFKDFLINQKKKYSRGELKKISIIELLICSIAYNNSLDL